MVAELFKISDYIKEGRSLIWPRTTALLSGKG
jgi:hypothetical protein